MHKTLLRRIEAIGVSKNGDDLIHILNIIAGLMCELDGGLKNASMIKEFNHDKLNIVVKYNKGHNHGN